MISLIITADDLGQDLHLNLSDPSAPSCLDKKQCETSSLMDEQGFELGKMGFRSRLAQGGIQSKHIVDAEGTFGEALSQMNRFRQLVGYAPHQIDGPEGAMCT